MKTTSKIFLMAVLCAVLAFSAISCGSGGGGGGGGGGGNDTADTTPPGVITTSPANGSVDVAINTSISVTFSEAMNPATMNTSTFTLKDSGNNPVTGTVGCSGATATFTPAVDLVYSTTYTVTITTGVKDMAGNAMTGNYSYNFTTGIAPDTEPPTVHATSPVNGATDVAVNTSVSATFSEAMNPATINTSTFTLKDSGNNPVTGTVGYAVTTATFTPDAALAFSETYTATVTSGAQDLAGNPLAVDYTWTFTTEESSTFTVIKTGTGTGTVISSPAGINCGIDCSETYASATEVTLTATPDSGSIFEGFSGGCNSILPTCSLTLNGDGTVTAVFNTLNVSEAGNQLGLNGIDDVAVHQLTSNPPASTLDLSTFTIEAWVYPLADSTVIIAADSAYYLMVKSQPLRVEFAVMTSTGFPAFLSFAGGTNPLTLNQWNHVAGMVNNATGELRIAVNGELSGTLAMGGVVDFSFPQTFSVGNSYPQVLGDFPFIGRIDEVRLSSVVRYSGNFSPPSLLSADVNTLGLWHFDETEGATTFADSSGNGNTLTGLGGAATIAGTREVANSTPVANAGVDKNYSTSATVTLNGSGSYDLNGDPLTYFWTITSMPGGSSASLTGADTANPTFTADVDGSYEVSLVVNDGTDDSAADYVTITALTPGAPIAPLPDTGQTTCYDASGNVISCAGTGQDGEYSINPMSFNDNGNGTVTDNVTGLMWQQQDDNVMRTWGDAVFYCGGLSLGGHVDWRLPNEFELMGIVSYGTYSPAIDEFSFPNTNSSIGYSGYWSSTTFAGNSSNAWSVHFSVGQVSYFGNAYGFYVRCVRGTPVAQSFIDNGTVTDNLTGLIWQQEDDDITRTWQAALDYCDGLTLAGYTDWRLPDIKELRSIVDNSVYSPAIDPAAFPNTNSSLYWSSTTFAGNPSIAWSVFFYDGQVINFGKTGSSYVRCVR